MKSFRLAFVVMFMNACAVEFGENSRGQFVVQRPSVWCFSPGIQETLCYSTVQECINAETNEGDHPRIACRAVRR